MVEDKLIILEKDYHKLISRRIVQLEILRGRKVEGFGRPCESSPLFSLSGLLDTELKFDEDKKY